jgi:hypothetical protein
MSQITNTVVTSFRAVGGNVVSQLRSYAAGFGTIGQQINQTSNMSTRLNNQWRALGTTIRYAVAGTALYGLTSMVSKVSQLNVQLAQMQAISNAGIGTTVGISNNQVPTLLNNLMNTSVATITPLSEVNDAATNFLSTVQNVKPSELPTMLAQIGIGAKIAQTPIEDLTQAATTMQVAFNRKVNPQSIGQFSRMWQMLITTAPGARIAGSTIAQAMPGLASMFQLAPGHGVTGSLGQAQMMALSLGVLRTGMPASTGMRGLTYLLQSIAQPTGGASKALAGIGITPQFVASKGIFAGVMKLLGSITHHGNAKQLGAIDDTTMDPLDAQNGNLPGIPAAEMVKLRAMIPRIHGIRAALILSSQLQQRGDVSSIQQDLQSMLQVQDQNSKETHQLAKNWQQFRQRARLAEAANAINTMGLQVAQTFEPVMGFVAQHVLDPVAGAARRHPRATRDITLGAGALIAALGVGRFTGITKMFGGPGQAIVREQAITAAMTGGAGLGASPQHPLYVVVVGQLFGGNTPSPTNEPTPHGGGWFSKITGGASSFLGIKALTSFGGRIPGLLGKGASGLEGFGAEMPGIGDWRMWLPGAFNPITHRRNPGWENFLTLGALNRQHGIIPGNQYARDLQRAQRAFPGRNISGVESMLRGQADVNLVIDLTDPHTGKMTRQRVHIPIGLWEGGRSPSHRGQVHKTVRSR